MKNIEEKLASDILMLMANNFDQWQPGSNSEAAEAIMRSAHLAAQGMAKKLTAALAQNSQELNPAALDRHGGNGNSECLHGAYGRRPSGQTRGQNASFASAVAEITACAVAPGSKWVLDIEKKQEQKLRSKLQSLGVCPENIREVVQQWRSARESDRLK